MQTHLSSTLICCSSNLFGRCRLRHCLRLRLLCVICLNIRCSSALFFLYIFFLFLSFFCCFFCHIVRSDYLHVIFSFRLYLGFFIVQTISMFGLSLSYFFRLDYPCIVLFGRIILMLVFLFKLSLYYEKTS